MGEELLVRLVHLGEVVHGGDEDVDLDDLCERRAGGGEHGGQVVDALLGHLADVVGAQRQDLAVGLAGDLARAVDGAAGLDGLRVGACCLGGVSVCVLRAWFGGCN